MMKITLHFFISTKFAWTPQWRHNGCDGVSNHKPHHCLLNRVFRSRAKKRQSSASLAFVRGIHRWPVNSPHKLSLTRKMLSFDDVIMKMPPEKCRPFCSYFGVLMMLILTFCKLAPCPHEPGHTSTLVGLDTRAAVLTGRVTDGCKTRQTTASISATGYVAHNEPFNP